MTFVVEAKEKKTRYILMYVDIETSVSFSSNENLTTLLIMYVALKLMVRVQYCFTKILIEFELLGHGSRPSSSQRAVGSSQNKGGGSLLRGGGLYKKHECSMALGGQQKVAAGRRLRSFASRCAGYRI